MSHTEPEKSGLPRVLGHVEVSTKSKFGFSNHISDLVNLLFRVACDEQLPGKGPTCNVECKSKRVKMLQRGIINCKEIWGNCYF